MRAKQRMRPSAHPDLCLATIPPGGRSGGWDDPAMKHANPLRRARRVADARRAGGPVRRRRGARAPGRDRLRRALRRPHRGGARGPRRGRARRSSTTARGSIASPSGRTVLRTSPARRTRGTRGTRRRWGRRATCARGPSATSGASPAWTPRACSPTRTPTSASSGSSATTRGSPRSQGRSATCSWPKRGSAGEGRSPITYLGDC